MLSLRHHVDKVHAIATPIPTLSIPIYSYERSVQSLRHHVEDKVHAIATLT